MRKSASICRKIYSQTCNNIGCSYAEKGNECPPWQKMLSGQIRTLPTRRSEVIVERLLRARPDLQSFSFTFLLVTSPFETRNKPTKFIERTMFAMLPFRRIAFFRSPISPVFCTEQASKIPRLTTWMCCVIWITDQIKHTFLSCGALQPCTKGNRTWGYKLLG